jgi:hypothetical protein
MQFVAGEPVRAWVKTPILALKRKAKRILPERVQRYTTPA